jgi:hypothetical protein
MAAGMDKGTRNAIERATQGARKLLERDFVSQLEGTFDVLRTGEVAIRGGGHLSAEQLHQRDRIVSAINHKRAAGMTSGAAVVDFIRDAAFTTLNRFAALKMLEARDLVQECITKGERSSGYREFCGMAPGIALLEDGIGYRRYIESLFDELTTEVKVLFDRRDSASLLWPKRQTFEALLELLNGTELSNVWGEDEAIGWVYQYFNSQDERKEMRDASSAPRDSRELAVRNQFFTPRYVVQCLLDNTLGRIWYEMTEGQTRLLGICAYLIVRPGETYGPRPKKDPRDLRILDPACGSGHFLLYAFDLLATVYEEAWNDNHSPASEGSGRTLREDYPTAGDLQSALPGLILRFNLHGIDIDPRCAQIAQLALWMRAQRCFGEAGIPRSARPPIRRMNIVVAEPMPGEADLQAEFLLRLGDDGLAGHFGHLVERMKLAGNLGLLLRPEELVQPARFGETRGLFDPPMERIRSMLESFVEEAVSNEHVRRRLFHDDAIHGLGLVELGELRFDVVVMNPPFGAASEDARATVDATYPDSRYDIGAVFIDECSRRLAPSGRLGVIFNRTNWFLGRLARFRSRQLREYWLPFNVDLGLGVLDAFVETALTVVANERPKAEGDWIRVVDADDKAGALEAAVAAVRSGVANQRVFVRDQSAFSATETCPFSYWVPDSLLKARRQESLGDRGFEPKQGLATKDNFRFLRLHWEVARNDGERWKLYSKGGAYAPLVGTYHLVIDWGRSAHAAYEQRDGQFCCLLTGQAHRYAFRPAVTYSQRTSRFSARIYPAGGLFDTKGSCVFAPSVLGSDDPNDELLSLCLLLNTSLAQFFFDASAGASDEGKARDYSQGMVGALPAPSDVAAAMQPLAAEARSIFAAVTAIQTIDPTSVLFCGVPPKSWWRADAVERHTAAAGDLQDRLESLLAQATQTYASEIGLDPTAAEFAIETVRGMHRSARHDALDVSPDQVRSLVRQSLLLEALGGAVPKEHANEVEACAVELLRPLPWGVLSRTVSPKGILVDDPGHPMDLPSAIQSRLEELAISESDSRAVLGVDDLRVWCSSSAFAEHIAMFSRSQRNAPIAWQLATPSHAYSVWLYAPALSSDTMYKLQSEFIAKKLTHEERKLESLRAEMGSGGKSSEREKVASQELFVEELHAFLDEAKRVAPLCIPDPDDGVLINFAALWRLVPQNKVWQVELKATWDALSAGAYDWAKLAMHLWPERVVPKCGVDRSLAISHGLEDIFWIEGVDGRWKARSSPLRTVDELVRERSSPAVKAALKSLLEAPTAQASGGRRSPRKLQPTSSGRLG